MNCGNHKFLAHFKKFFPATLAAHICDQILGLRICKGYQNTQKLNPTFSLKIKEVE